jgi:DNA-binding response OmpR family regulator
MTMLDQNSLILIVDDNPKNVKMLFDVLEFAGFRTLIAKSGEDALEALEFAKPDLILLDIMMPGIDGFETCIRIKANSKTQEIPVIFMTALSDVGDKIKGLNSGAVDYITKPFHQEEVLARVKNHLELYQLRRSLEQRVIDRTSELAETVEQLQQVQTELQQSQLELVQHEKMSALGNLVAGVAHEINNPVSFISGNIELALGYIRDLLGLIGSYQTQFPNPGEKIEDEIEVIDLDYVKEDLPKLIYSMQEGADRIFNICTSLRTFSRADNERKQPFNIHDGIDSTL